jgi:hypothetical protein
MQHSIPQTALPGRSQSSHDRLAEGLGYFSIALGVTELLAPKAVCEAVGLDGYETLVRAYGAREVANGLAILTSHDPTPWIWGRVIGDAADIATVAMGLQDGNPKKDNTVLALAAVAAVTAVDLYCANGLTSEKGGRRTALTDYSSRTGFPQGIRSAKGAARDFEVPKDMRVPDLLRPDVFARRNGQNAPAIPASAS